MSAFRVQYVNEEQSYDTLIPPSLTYMTKNLYVSDKYILLNNQLLKEKNISHIVCLLPTQEIADELTKDVKRDFHITLLDYGDVHEPGLDKRTKETCDMIEEVTKEKNVLIFCNNGYQRTMPFLFYYLTKYKGESFEKAAHNILGSLDSRNWSNSYKDRDAYYKPVIEAMKIIINNNVL